MEWNGNYFIYNHLGSKAVEVDSVGNIIDYVQYSPFGAHTSTLLSAGGVRKYDYEIGRFTSVDPLWEKYIGWTGYQYSGNNPVNLVDRDGRKVTNNLTDGSEMSNLINNVYAKSETFKNMFDALNSIDYPITYKFGKLEERVLGKFIPYIDPDHSVITPGLNIPIKYESINVKKAEIIIDNSKKDSPDYNEIRTLGHETNHGHQFFLHPLIFWNYGIWSAFKNLKHEDDKLEIGGTIEGKEFEGSLIIGSQVYQEYNK